MVGEDDQGEEMNLRLLSRILLVTTGIPALALNAQARQQKQYVATDTTAMVRGTVTDDAGLPLAGVKVVAAAKILKADPVGIIEIHDSTLTSDSGTYVFPALELNSPSIKGADTWYFLNFSKAGYRPGYSTNFDLNHLNPGDTETFDVRLAKMIELTVIAVKAGTPETSATGASVVLSANPAGPRPLYRYGFIPANGMFSFADVDGGYQFVTVALAGYKPVVVLKTLSGLMPRDSIRVVLEKSNPDSTRTLIVKFPDLASSPSKDTMIFSSADYLHVSLLAIADSGVFTFRDIPDSCSSGTLTTGSFTDTTTLTGPVTQMTFRFHPGLAISPGHGHASGNGKKRELPRPVPYYFDMESGKSFDILGKPRSTVSAPAIRPADR